MERQEEEKGILRELGGWVLYILIIIGLTYLIITFVGQRTRVSGSSMETTLSDGDNLIVDKLSYRFWEPKRYDIIVFPYQHEENTFYIKRIIGLPGETVEVIENSIFIDGERLEEEYETSDISDLGIAADGVELGENEYFVLGDDRENSEDSRSADVGNVRRKDIYGKAWFVSSPLKHAGFIR